MKKILLITSIYPMLDKSYSGSPVCHYFTREWKKMGYDVRVVHFITRFPNFYYLIAKFFREFIEAKTGYVIFLKVPKRFKKYTIDDVPVLLIPLFKILPHSTFSNRVVYKALSILYKNLEDDSFIPDFVTGHFALPQLQFLYLLKAKFYNIKTCMVLHSNGHNIPSIYANYFDYFNSVDLWGFRSEAFKLSYIEKFRPEKDSFICYSGIPDDYIVENSNIKYKYLKGINHFSFLGSLYKLKRVQHVIVALAEVFGDEYFKFDIIGDGAEKHNIEKLIIRKGLKNRVILHGEVERDQAQKILYNSQCFIMLSSREAFGLVYIEAMAKGCITIGTRGQGIDGVIKHGENGFLCSSSDTQELTSLLKHLLTLSPLVLERISFNAVETARSMTDRKVAEHYISSLMSTNKC